MDYMYVYFLSVFELGIQSPCMQRLCKYVVYTDISSFIVLLFVAAGCGMRRCTSGFCYHLVSSSRPTRRFTQWPSTGSAVDVWPPAKLKHHSGPICVQVPCSLFFLVSQPNKAYATKEAITSQAIPKWQSSWANMGALWGRQDPGGPHVGPINFAIWVALCARISWFFFTCRAAPVNPMLAKC